MDIREETFKKITTVGTFKFYIFKKIKIFHEKICRLIFIDCEYNSVRNFYLKQINQFFLKSNKLSAERLIGFGKKKFC